MYFDSFAELINMDGHGFYVWLAYAVTLLVLTGLLVAPRLQRKRFVLEYRRSRKRQQKSPSATHKLDIAN